MGSGERSAYREGYDDGYAAGVRFTKTVRDKPLPPMKRLPVYARLKKRKLSAWNKFVKANSKKPRFKYRTGKLNLKKMAVAFRKTPAGKKKRR